MEKMNDKVKASFADELNRLIKSEKYDKIAKLISEIPNDMDLGKAIRTFFESKKSEVNKPPFTDDYIQ